MYEVPGMSVSVKSVAEIKGRYHAVKMTAEGVQLATAAADNVLGFIQREAKAGEIAQVMVDGITMAHASGTIAKGAFVTAAADGKVAAAASGNKYCGIAMEAASAGEIVPVLIRFGTMSA